MHEKKRHGFLERDLLSRIAWWSVPIILTDSFARLTSFSTGISPVSVVVLVELPDISTAILFCSIPTLPPLLRKLIRIPSTVLRKTRTLLMTILAAARFAPTLSTDMASFTTTITNNSTDVIIFWSANVERRRRCRVRWRSI